MYKQQVVYKRMMGTGLDGLTYLTKWFSYVQTTGCLQADDVIYRPGWLPYHIQINDVTNVMLVSTEAFIERQLSLILSADGCLSKMKNVLSTMVANGRVDTSICDDVLQQFRSFLYEDVAANKQEFLNFNPRDKDQRIESFLRYVNNHIKHFCFKKKIMWTCGLNGYKMQYYCMSISLIMFKIIIMIESLWALS